MPTSPKSARREGQAEQTGSDVRKKRRWPVFAVVPCALVLLSGGGYDDYRYIYLPDRLRRTEAAAGPIASRSAQRLREEQRRVGRKFRDCAECPQMVSVPSGLFTMGSPVGEEGRSNHEGPRHVVRIDYRFAVGVHEVTFAEWDGCANAGGCGGHIPEDNGWGRGNRPVINVSWEDAQAYVRWLAQKTGETYRLLSESEWEYVARAGTTTPFNLGSTISTDQANYNGDYTYASGRKGPYRDKTVSVGSFSPNAWGLYDVHGNVWEWVEDCWYNSYAGAPADGSAWEHDDCSKRVLRGGSWSASPWSLRSAYRIRSTTGTRDYLFGFRVARTIEEQ